MEQPCKAILRYPAEDPIRKRTETAFAYCFQPLGHPGDHTAYVPGRGDIWFPRTPSRDAEG
jgi:hypothetical protein